jgi:hypothetical protein
MGITGIIGIEGRGGGAGLRLSFPRASVKGAGGALSSCLTEEGSLVSGGEAPRCFPWRFESLGEEADEAFLLGPAFVGRSLDSCEGIEDGLPLLAAAARALDRLSREGRLPRGLVSSGILVGSGGEVLVLPASAASRALAARGPEVRAAAAARLIHPRSEGPEADASFLLAQAAYRLAAGAHPYPREAAEAGSSAPHSPPALPLALAAPRLDRELASLVDEALADPGAASLGRWLSVLGKAAERGWLRELEPEEEKELAGRKAAAIEAARRKEAASSFLRRRGALIAGIAAAAVLAGLFASSMLGRKAGMPDLSGLSPLQVAQAYYRAIDSLDMETLEVAADKKARKEDDNIAVNITILQKTRIAYESGDPLVKASAWLEKGKPALDPTALLFGVTGLELRDEGGSSIGLGATREIRARYSLWYIEKSDTDAAPVPTEDRRIDELTLQKAKEGWKIVDIRRSAAPRATYP